MLRTLHPFFGDLVLRGVVVLSFLFVLGLILDAWWQKRQARLMRELSKRQLGHPPHRATRLRAFFKRFWRRFIVLLVVVSMATVLLLLARKNINARAINSTDGGGISAYATNFQGDATRPVLMAATNHLGFQETNLSLNPNWIHTGKVSLTNETAPSPSPAETLTTNAAAAFETR